MVGESEIICLQVDLRFQGEFSVGEASFEKQTFQDAKSLQHHSSLMR